MGKVMVPHINRHSTCRKSMDIQVGTFFFLSLFLFLSLSTVSLWIDHRAASVAKAGFICVFLLFFRYLS
jgi:hypothetical protein